MSRMYFALSLTATICAGVVLLAILPASAGERHGFSVGVGIYHHDHYRGDLRPLPYPRPHVHAGVDHHRGPALYYSYHYDHIPAYPVPVFQSYHPPRVHRTVVYPAAAIHVEWCHARYRSYRAYDNSFQPYHGHRRPCWSPYS